VGAIIGKNVIYIFDTSWQVAHMEELKSYLSGITKLTDYIIIISHADFDHFLGNAAFPNSEIVSSVACYKAMKKQTRKGIQKKYGIVLSPREKIILPTKTFEIGKIYLEDKISISYYRIHTLDSVCLYMHDKYIFFAADNVEAPIPYLNHPNLQKILDEYDRLRSRITNILVPGHGEICQGKELLLENIAYIKALIKKDTAKYEKPPYAEIHQTNMEVLKWK
jgi:glyoxylase-like metal-dependent hydrolase (beta-lactamase superfamily II)